ncbi:apolipoprotein N-acyltransferase [Roseinatronobacter thiooxidans]|uniref:Apolipoprotein N-acyltransferase n=1 Tax=Roseinatronobacter thiooxidans TaxID=121821 RepID=A0A2W7QIK4_9RHOB|nr:apolipoprotein N-acyltransferase [Roseinatronobacter thiooxidans]PZX47166.1 apolipoprotein N-acyltransferase [Roseinatronobacter thiooxidans]
MTAPPRWHSTAQLALAYGGLGLLAAAGQAPLGWWWLTIAALAGVFAMLPLSATPRAFGGRMWLAGTGYFGAALFWIIEPFFVEPEIHGWMAPFALVLMAGGMALFWGLAGVLAARLAQGRWRLAVLAVLIVLSEMLRGWVFTGFPWAMLGHALIGTPVMQLAAVTGASGLSLLLVLAAVLPVLGRDWPLRATGAALSVALFAAIWGWGSARTELPPTRDTIIRLAQPNAPQSEKWHEENMFLYFNRLLDQTASPTTPAPKLILWPETSVPFLLEYAGEGLDMIADAAALHGPEARVGFGVQRVEGGRYFNSLAILNTDADVTHIYDKHHLVPFGEYIPFGEWLMGTPVGGLAGRALLGYSPGPGPQVLDLGPLGQALPLICYESIFPRHLRTEARPDWVLQVTNDAWFGEVTGPFQHLAQARLRAVEQGLPVLRVANTGVSAFIDARGGVVAELGLGQTGYLDGAIPGALPPTFYARHGDWPMVLLLVLFSGGAVLAGKMRRTQ